MQRGIWNTCLLHLWRNSLRLPPVTRMIHRELPMVVTYILLYSMYCSTAAYCACLVQGREAQKGRGGEQVWHGNPHLMYYFYTCLGGPIDHWTILGTLAYHTVINGLQSPELPEEHHVKTTCEAAAIIYSPHRAQPRHLCNFQLMISTLWLILQ